MKIFNDIALAAPEIMLPREGTDLSKWAVIACDQYTSEPEYWEKVSKNAGDMPSSLNVILPEVYLNNESEEQITARLKKISETANSYLSEGIWNTLSDGMIVIDRSTSAHPSRKGLVAAIDLEQYSFEPGNHEKIRATEGTVISRIPPRVRIRANSPVELPHIMLLIDDPDKTVVEKAWDSSVAHKELPIYDTDLMEGSGHVKGYFINANTDIFENAIEALSKLCGKPSSDGLLFAVGDGNHSLASAKAHWLAIKDSIDVSLRDSHPARYALAEIVNIHDAGLDFEPIHRVAFNLTRDAFVASATRFFRENGVSFDDHAIEGCQSAVIVNEGEEDLYINLKNPPHTLAVGSVQQFLDAMVNEDDSISVDYIHGDSSVRSLAAGNNTGVILPAISKSSFFSTIIKEGVFPRKTFSMGEAFEKRFYLEAKLIK